MPSRYSDDNLHNVLPTLRSVKETLIQLLEWNKNVDSAESYYESQTGMQLLAANCMLITAIGEGINRVMRIAPDFLKTYFPETPWRAIIGMRNHIAHGYFELDADVVFDAIKNDIPPLLNIINKAIEICK